jgi:HD superfamily phosphohydrolase YqeK
MNLEKAKEEFIKYTENYDLEIERIKGKQIHSLRVMEISKQIAEKLGLSQEEIAVATLIGLLHDIARFEQFTQYGTYKDLESFDHGDIGSEILRKDLRKYISTDKYDKTIIRAVKNHNKFKIEEGLTEEEILQAQIIRDADKIDIFYQGCWRFWKGKEAEVEESIISEDVIEQIKNNSQTKRKLKETPVDNIMRVIAFIFDINFKSSFQVLKEQDYINKILDRYKFKDEYTRQQVEKIRNIANEYITERAK